MSITRDASRYFTTLLGCLAAIGCGQSASEGVAPVGSKGKAIARVELPDKAGKAVLDELGVTELQVKPKVPGGQNAESSAKKSTKDAPAGTVAGQELTTNAAPTVWIAAGELPYEFWEVQYLGNRPVGYLHQMVVPSPTGAAGILRIDAESFIRVSRDKKRLDQHLSVTSIEEADGRLRTIEARVKQGDMETRIDGMVILGSLRLKTQSPDKASAVDIPWPNEFGGPFAVAQSLRASPMNPGETRNLSMLDPIHGQLVKVTLKSKDYLKTPLLDGNQHSLLEITSEAQAGTSSLVSTLWASMNGEILKTYTGALDIRSFRVERSMAESIRDAAACEKLTKTEIKLNSPIDKLAMADKLVFQVSHPDRDPFPMLPGRTNQSVKSSSAFSAQVTVFAMKEKSPRPAGVAEELIEDSLYSKASPVLQSDDEIVKRIADQFYVDTSLGKSVLERLRRGVYNWIETKSKYTPSMSNAAEVARSRAGDSTEHAMLLAAVVRARGVPSRVAFGLIYNESQDDPALVFHAWTEVYLKDHWVSIDASIEKPDTNASYLKLVDSPLADHNPYAALLAALEAIQQLEIKIRE